MKINPTNVISGVAGVPAPTCYGHPWAGPSTAVRTGQRVRARGRIAPTPVTALEQSPVRMSLPVLDTHATDRTKDAFGPSGLRTKEPPG